MFVGYGPVTYAAVTYVSVSYGTVTYDAGDSRELTNMHLTRYTVPRGCGISASPLGENRPFSVRAEPTGDSPGGLVISSARTMGADMNIREAIRKRTRKNVTRRVLEPVITLIAIAITLFFAFTVRAARSAR